MSDYGKYNDDNGHDMWVDHTYHENTGELNDWYGENDGDGGSIVEHQRALETERSKPVIPSTICKKEHILNIIIWILSVIITLIVFVLIC